MEPRSIGTNFNFDNSNLNCVFCTNLCCHRRQKRVLKEVMLFTPLDGLKLGFYKTINSLWLQDKNNTYMWFVRQYKIHSHLTRKQARNAWQCVTFLPVSKTRTNKFDISLQRTCIVYEVFKNSLAKKLIGWKKKKKKTFSYHLVLIKLFVVNFQVRTATWETIRPSSTKEQILSQIKE